MVTFKRDYIVDIESKNNDGVFIDTCFIFRKGYSYNYEIDGCLFKIYNIDKSVIVYFDSYDRKKYLEE